MNSRWGKRLGLSLFYAFLILSGPIGMASNSFGPGTAAGLASGMNCGSCAGASSLSGNEDSSAGFNVGFPVDIPSPVAKGIDTIDSSSVQFSGAGSQLVKGGHQLSKYASSSLGVISGTLATLTTATIGVVVSGEYVDEITTTDGTFSYTVPAIYEDLPIAFVVFEAGGNITDGGTVGAPIIITIYRAFDRLTFSVVVTNDSSYSGYEVYNKKLAFNDDGKIGFLSASTSGDSRIGLVSFSGGRPDPVDLNPNLLLDELDFASGYFYGVDASTGRVYTASDSGNLSSIGSPSNLDTGKKLRHSSNQEWLATTATVSGSKVLAVIDLLTGAQTNLTVSEPSTVLDMSYDWYDSNTIYVIKKYSSSNYVLQGYDITSIIDGTSSVVDSVTELYTSTTFIGDLAINSDNQNIFYSCYNSSTNKNSLCLYAPASHGGIQFDSSQYNISNVRVSSDAGCAVFEADSDTTTLSDNGVGFYNPGINEGIIIAKGFKPEIFYDGTKSVVAYLTLDSAGHNQIGILNLSRECSTFATDSAGPSVIDTIPFDGDSIAAADFTELTAYFSEDITVNLGSITVSKTSSGTSISGSTTFGGQSMYFIPNSSDNICLATSYTATVSSTVKDTNQNSMGTAYSWEFSTNDGSWSTGGATSSLGTLTSSPKIAVNSSGNAMAVWVQNDSGTFNVYASYYLDSTGLWGSPTQLSDGIANATVPDVAVSNNDAVVVWLQNSGANQSVFSKQFSFNGNSWSGSTALAETTNVPAGSPKIAYMSGGGKFVATWYFTDYSVWANVYTTISGWGTEQQISAAAVDIPSLNIWASSTQVGITWGEDTGAGNYLREVIYNGSSFDAPLQIRGSDTGSLTSAAGTSYSLHVYADSSFNVAYSLRATASRTVVVSNQVADNIVGGTIATTPIVASNGSRYAYAAWVHNLTGTNYLYMMRFDFQSLTWTNPILVTYTGGTINNVNLAVDSTGNAMIIYAYGDARVMYAHYHIDQEQTDDYGLLMTGDATVNGTAIAGSSNGKMKVITTHTNARNMVNQFE